MKRTTGAEQVMKQTVAEQIIKEIQQIMSSQEEHVPNMVHFIDGRDSPLEIISEESYDMLNTRVGRFWYAASAVVNAHIIGVKDHKGWITVVWASWPHLKDIAACQDIWYRFCECTISHIMFHHGRFKPVDVQHDDTYPPSDFQETVDSLGLTNFEGYRK